MRIRVGMRGIMRQKKALNSLWAVVFLPAVALLLMASPALAQKPGKRYPEEGKVIGQGTTGHTTGAGGSWYTHTYKIETVSTVFVLDCGKKPFFTAGGTGQECGGEKKLQLGDVIHFRVEKTWVYIAVGGSEQEQKLRILDQEMKPEAKRDQVKPTPESKPQSNP